MANLGVITARLQGVKEPRTTWFNPYELIQRKREVDSLVPMEVALFYLDLQKRGQLPVWVEQMTDLELMELAAIG